MSGSELSVDVIVDNYNYEPFLEVAIESALGQTYPRTRVIVVDDGSTDGSRRILERFANRIVVVLKENGGQASALNAGFGRSDADVVMFLDSDDVLLPQTAASVVAVFDRSPEVVKVQFGLEVIGSDGAPTGAVLPAPHLPLPQGDVRAEVLTRPFDLTWMSTSGMAFRRSTLERAFPIPEESFRQCADWYLQHVVALFGPVASERWVGAQYRIHGRNSYQRVEALDLDQVRKSVEYASVTRVQLVATACLLGIPHGEIRSVSEAANRLILKRLVKSTASDSDVTVARLVADGWRAAASRNDVTTAVRAAFVMWFAAMAVVPRPLARPLAEYFLVPERRLSLNRVLAHQHRTSA